MPRLLIYAIVFIEGFSSLGAEVIALRRLLPHVGSSIVVTAPTIGFFLLALALGYASGARVAGNYQAAVARNFLISAALAGVAADLPDGVVDVVRVTAAAVSLAATLRAAGLSPTAALAELDRAFRVCGPAHGARALDAALDAVRLLPPIVPRDGPAQGLRSPTSPFGHPAPSGAADGASEPAGETIRGLVDDGPPRGDEVL